MGQGHAGNRCGTEQSPQAAMASSRPPWTPVPLSGREAACCCHQATTLELPLPWWEHVCGRGREGQQELTSTTTQKKNSRPSPSVGPGLLLAVLASVLGLSGCLSSVLLGLNRAVSPRPAHHLTAHRASRCFGSMQSRQPTKPSTSLSCLPVPHLGIHLAIPSHHQTRVPVWSRRGRDSNLFISWEKTSPPLLAQRRNAHSRSPHQCMINLPISSLRFHPPSVPAQLGPVLVLVLCVHPLVLSLHPLASPRLEFGASENS